MPASQHFSLAAPFSHALPVGQDLFQEPIYLTHIGWEKVHPSEIYRRDDPPFFSLHWDEGRTLPEFCLALNVQGRGEYETKRHGGRIEPGQAFLYRPGEWHRHRPLANAGWTIMWMHFNGNASIQWIKDEAFQLDGNLVRVEQKALFRAQFERLIASAGHSPGHNQVNFGLQALGLLSHFVKEQAGGETLPREPLSEDSVQRVVEYIWNFSHGIVDVPTLAQLVGVPRRTLDRHFRSRTGRSILGEIQLCRITRAATLLTETKMPIKHVVYRAGFRSEEHLRLVFQKTHGCSPIEYRKQGGELELRKGSPARHAR